MKVKPLKIKIKEPTPSAADRLYAKHQAIRKARGLPDPSEYKKKLDSMKTEETEQLDEMPESSMKTRDVHSHLRKAGWSLSRTKGGHDVYSHPKAKEHIAVPRHKQLKAPLIRGIMKASKVSEEIEQLDELSPATKASYKTKAQGQVKELQPWTKKGEYKDLAKNLIAKRQKGIAKVSEETELDEQLYKKARFVSGPAKKPFKSNTVASPMSEGENEQVKGGDPCWKGYEMVGKKKKNGREVPNCVPVKEDTGESVETHTLSRKAQIVKDAAKGKGKKDKQNAKDEASDKFQKEPELSSDIQKT